MRGWIASISHHHSFAGKSSEAVRWHDCPKSVILCFRLLLLGFCILIATSILKKANWWKNTACRSIHCPLPWRPIFIPRSLRWWCATRVVCTNRWRSSSGRRVEDTSIFPCSYYWFKSTGITERPCDQRVGLLHNWDLFQRKCIF